MTKLPLSTYYIVRLLLGIRYPNCRQTTLASGVLQTSSHTVPHTPSLQTSTLPSSNSEPSLNCISPWVQALEKDIIGSVNT